MKTILCPRCNKKPAILHPSFGVTDCADCKARDKKIREHPEFATLSMQDRITSQRDKHIADIAQPYNPDGTPNETFVKSNLKEDVLEYFSPQELDQAGF